MSVRLAACEPCRRSKQACGHERPICDRCRNRDQSRACVYRARPFKRSRIKKSNPTCTREVPATTTDDSASSSGIPDENPADQTTRDVYRYPNPGFLGQFSQSGILDQVSTYATLNPHVPDTNEPNLALFDLLRDRDIFDKAIHCVNRLERLGISNLCRLVRMWLQKGVNLSLGGPLVAKCNEAMLEWAALVAPRDSEGGNSNLDIQQQAQTLLRNTNKVIVVRKESSPNELFAQMIGDNLRLETAGLFLTAAARAVLDTPYFDLLYAGEDQRRSILRAIAYVGDCCVELCLALDCLNDLQLVLQYENFIVHSFVDGDRNIENQSHNIPDFIAELRKACFARLYALDKNTALFFGRPPRMVKDYCCFQLPANLSGVWSDDTDNTATSSRVSQAEDGEVSRNQPREAEAINYMAGTRCCALFASFKEDILWVFHNRARTPEAKITNKIAGIRQRVEAQWAELPSHFRLATDLKDCHAGPFARDFLAGTRLDYLHTVLLLNLASEPSISKPNSSTITIAAEMLSLTLEMVVLRDHLVNSGTSLTWKVALYGLPAAGMVSMALLTQGMGTYANSTTLSFSKLVQDLSVLVAEIRLGAWMQKGDPNFSLFTQATRTIQSVLDSALMQNLVSSTVDLTNASHSNLGVMSESIVGFPAWNFEMDFWMNLEDHLAVET
ncbi:hypothetical protein F5Y08DRAFT_347959 [Xylaria arbuscula]|nr:hypothetical protein F5Y08DRAFT_347959 [Xylaria arbuscula]